MYSFLFKFRIIIIFYWLRKELLAFSQVHLFFLTQIFVSTVTVLASILTLRLKGDFMVEKKKYMYTLKIPRWPTPGPNRNICFTYCANSFLQFYLQKFTVRFFKLFERNTFEFNPPTGFHIVRIGDRHFQNFFYE